MTKRKFRIIGLNQNINPDFSVAFLRHQEGYGNMFNVFRESDGTNQGAFSENMLLKQGFTKSQLDKVRKTGTTNFTGEKKIKYTCKSLVRLENDNWGRKVFRNPKTGSIFKDVDGKLYNVTKEGEPDCPLKKQIW
jgi:hypothetical protein